MVNIVAITYITDAGVSTFSSFPEYYSHLLRVSNPTQRVKLRAQKALYEEFSSEMAAKYKCQEVEAENVAFLFGGIEETTRQLENRYLRELLFCPETQIVVDFKYTGSSLFKVLTIHIEGGLLILKFQSIES